MRLIDADEFKEIIVAYEKAGFTALRINKICELIDGQTTAYNVDKVVERLEELLWDCYTDNGDGFEIYKRRMKEIVKSGCIE